MAGVNGGIKIWQYQYQRNVSEKREICIEMAQWKEEGCKTGRLSWRTDGEYQSGGSKIKSLSVWWTWLRWRHRQWRRRGRLAERIKRRSRISA